MSRNPHQICISCLICRSTIVLAKMKFLFVVSVLGFLYPCAWGEQMNEICQPTRHQDARDDILAFFEVRDALDITWLHAVNSPSKLKEGLTGDIMMLEADVLMRNNLVNGTPVMAHPPAVDSNLTLADFLNQTLASTKGIKLDFKTIMVVEPSLKMVKNVTSGRTVKNPIWLNADVLPGPCYDRVCVPVYHEQFLALCNKYFPKATLSISWTTGKDMTPAENYYNWSQVLMMGKLVSQISQPITFPIRAVLVKRSWKQLHWLLDLSETFTITIWSSVYDKLDAQDLVELRRSVADKRRIYYDLPPDQDKAFKDALKSPGSNYNKDGAERFPWRPIAAKRCEDVIVGGNSVMFSGDGGLVISKKILYKVYARYYLFVNGICSFIKTNGPDEKRSITIRMHAENITGSVTNTTEKATSLNHGKIMTLVLHSNGIFQMTINGVDTKEGSVKSETGAFKFTIVESSVDGKHRTFKCEITAQDSKEEKASVSLTTESEPMAGHVLISTGAQSGAILVQNVESLVAAEATGGASTGHYSFHTFVIVLCASAANIFHV